MNYTNLIAATLASIPLIASESATNEKFIVSAISFGAVFITLFIVNSYFFRRVMEYDVETYVKSASQKYVKEEFKKLSEKVENKREA